MAESVEREIGRMMDKPEKNEPARPEPSPLSDEEFEEHVNILRGTPRKPAREKAPTFPRGDDGR